MTSTARCAAGEDAGRDGEMDKGGRVTVTLAGMAMGVEPMCEAHRDVEWRDLVIIRDMLRISGLF